MKDEVGKDEGERMKDEWKDARKALMMRKSVKWATPPDLYEELDREFNFTLDPCPIDWDSSTHPDGLQMDWTGQRVYCNPPYGRGVDAWLEKAMEAEVAVFLLPSRTDTAWWHDYAMRAAERRFIRGRLKFGDAKDSAPFPSVVLVFRGHCCSNEGVE